MDRDQQLDLRRSRLADDDPVRRLGRVVVDVDPRIGREREKGYAILADMVRDGSIHILRVDKLLDRRQGEARNRIAAR